MYAIRTHILLWWLALLLMAPMAASAQDEVVATADSIVTTYELKQIRKQEKTRHRASVAEETTTPAVWTIRTNLLRWLTFTSDVGVSWQPMQDWEYVATATWTTLTWHQMQRRYALWSLSAEARRHFTAGSNWYAGGMIEFGRHHYKFTETGREGEVYGVGLTAGWQHKLSRYLAIDIHVGLGADFSDFDAYDLQPSWNKVRLYRTYLHDECNLWLGLNQLGINLVWELPFQKGVRP